MDERRSPSTVTLPMWLLAPTALFGVLMLVLMAVNVTLIEKQLDTVRDQRRAVDRQEPRLTPVVKDTGPVIDAAREELPRLRDILQRVDLLTATMTPLADELPQAAQTTRRVDRLTRELMPLVPQIAEVVGPPQRIDQLVRSATQLISRVDDTDVVPTAKVAARFGAELARSLSAADAPGAVRRGRQAAEVLLENRRLRRVLVGALRLMRTIERERVIPRGARAARHVPEITALVRRTERITAAMLETLRTSLQVQEGALRHVRSLDRKIGLAERPGP